MRVGDFSVSVLAKDKELPEVEAGGKSYVLAQPGQAYTVRVSVERGKTGGQDARESTEVGLLLLWDILGSPPLHLPFSCSCQYLSPGCWRQQ